MLSVSSPGNLSSNAEDAPGGANPPRDPAARGTDANESPDGGTSSVTRDSGTGGGRRYGRRSSDVRPREFWDPEDLDEPRGEGVDDLIL